MRYFLHLSYNGSAYAGWQIQPNGITIQAVLQDALSLLLKYPVQLTGCGRTDTGVHALNFYAHFDSLIMHDEKDLAHLLFRLNRLLSKDICIYAIYLVPEDLHARFSAISRTYSYFVSLRNDPFAHPYQYQIGFEPNVEMMNQAAEKLKHYIDFTSFSKLHTQTKTNFCKISHAEWQRRPDGSLCFTITADRFLRNMVRALVGTLLEVGKGKMSLDRMDEIVLSKNRCEAGQSVPAKALFLTDVTYDPSLRAIDHTEAKPSLFF